MTIWKMVLENEDDKVDFNLYQKLAQRTANHDLEYEKRLAVAGLGLAGEAGEAGELIKKFLGHGHELDKDELEKELGDVLWYIAEICAIVNMDMEEVARKNIGKLYKRYPKGFEVEKSINR